MTFVSDEHCALMSNPPLFSAQGLGSVLALHNEPDLSARGAHAFASIIFMDPGALAAHVIPR
jgi:hypothetical protein